MTGMHKIVVAHYNESIDWIDAFREDYTVFVYHKGEHHEGAGGVTLPNIGREAHTYLHHIVATYEDNKDDKDNDAVTFFCQAGLADHERNFTGYISDSIASALASADGVSKVRAGAFKTPAIHAPSASFRILEWNGPLTRNRLDEDFGTWFSRVMMRPLPDLDAFMWIRGANFAVRNSAILAKPKAYYASLLSEFEVEPSVSPEVAHFFERAWQYVF